MTRRDYILIAEVLRVEWNLAHLAEKAIVNGGTPRVEREVIEKIALELCDSLHRDNPRFNADHFMAVVRMEKDLQSHPKRGGARCGDNAQIVHCKRTRETRKQES
jgi:hypothetical protein